MAIAGIFFEKNTIFGWNFLKIQPFWEALTLWGVVGGFPTRVGPIHFGG